MKSKLTRRLSMIGFAVLSLTGMSAEIFCAPPTLTLPAANGEYQGFSIQYSLPAMPLADSVSLTFSNGSTTRTLQMSDDMNVNFVIDPTVDLAATYPGQIDAVVGGTSIPDGTYTVTLAYQDFMANPAESDVHTNVTIRHTTPSPTLTSPAASTSYSSLNIDYTLPVSPQAGSVSLVFESDEDTITLEMADDLALDFDILPELDLSDDYPGKIVSVVGGTSIPDGEYQITLSYQDALGNPASEVQVSSVVIDTVTQTPQLSQPTSNYSGTSLPIEFEIPEEALSGSLQLMLSNSETTITITLKDDAETSFTLDPSVNLEENENVLSSSEEMIAEGVYTVTLSYQDALGNTASTAEADSVSISHLVTAAETSSGCNLAARRHSNLPRNLAFLLFSLSALFVCLRMRHSSFSLSHGKHKSL